MGKCQEAAPEATFYFVLLFSLVGQIMRRLRFGTDDGRAKPTIEAAEMI